MNVDFVFGIIFALIVIGLLLFFGFEQITKIIGINKDVLLKEQMTNLEKTADKVFEMSMGSTQDFDFKFYDVLEKVCFINTDDPSPNPGEDWDPTPFLVNITDRYHPNMIVFEKVAAGLAKPDWYNISHISPDQSFCMVFEGKLWLENKGTYVNIRK